MDRILDVSHSVDKDNGEVRNLPHQSCSWLGQWIWPFLLFYQVAWLQKLYTCSYSSPYSPLSTTWWSGALFLMKTPLGNWRRMLTRARSKSSSKSKTDNLAWRERWAVKCTIARSWFKFGTEVYFQSPDFMHTLNFLFKRTCMKKSTEFSTLSQAEKHQ